MSELRKTHFIYCIQQQANGEYIFLNRNYKPIGFNSNQHVKYEDYPIGIKMRITPKMAQKLSTDGKSDTKAIWFYKDASIPTRSATNMKAYLDKLALLMKYKTR